MSTKDELKAGLTALRRALTDRVGQFNTGPLAARWTGAALRSTGIGPARKRNAWKALADSPSGGAGVVTDLTDAASAVKTASAGSAGGALTQAENALSRLETLLGI